MLVKQHHIFGFLVTQVATRSLYNEDWLLEALNRGARQYVIIGAGLDSFALHDVASYPDTQALKIKTLSQIDKISDNVEFVPINFELEKLSDVLQRSSYDMKELGYFSWLGATHYLKPH